MSDGCGREELKWVVKDGAASREAWMRVTALLVQLKSLAIRLASKARSGFWNEMKCFFHKAMSASASEPDTHPCRCVPNLDA